MIAVPSSIYRIMFFVSTRKSDQPRYIELSQSGELETRARLLEARLHSCDICPRACGVDRTQEAGGFCHSGHLPVVSSFCTHHGEEPVISGSRGSGTVFFANCNLRCVYCQNHQISQNWTVQNRALSDCRSLALKMLHLQELGCHNINFVSPSHFVPQIVRALVEAVPMGLRLPLVYNTNSYDSPVTLRHLDGIIDIYLADIRYASDRWAKKFSQVSDYVPYCRAAIKEMYRQVGHLALDGDEIAVRGLLVRHLILPNALAGSEQSLQWLARVIGPETAISIMAQYSPQHRAGSVPLLSRTISAAEYNEVLELASALGMENGFIQDLDSVTEYLPDFDREGHPFVSTPDSEKAG